MLAPGSFADETTWRPLGQAMTQWARSRAGFVVVVSEQLLPERGRQYTVNYEAARCRSISLIIACVQLLLTIRHYRGATYGMLDCRRVPLSRSGRSKLASGGVRNQSPRPPRGGNRKSPSGRTYGRGALHA